MSAGAQASAGPGASSASQFWLLKLAKVFAVVTSWVPIPIISNVGNFVAGCLHLHKQKFAAAAVDFIGAVPGLQLVKWVENVAKKAKLIEKRGRWLVKLFRFTAWLVGFTGGLVLRMLGPPGGGHGANKYGTTPSTPPVIKHH